MVDCPVTVPPDKQLGDYANAFRMVQDSDMEWFLDFLVCEGHQATVVSRVRVRGEFLPFIRERLGATLGEAPVDFPVVCPKG